MMMIFQIGFQHVYVFLANCFDYKRGYMNMYNMYTYSLLLNLIYFHNFWFLFFLATFLAFSPIAHAMRLKCYELIIKCGANIFYFF